MNEEQFNTEMAKNMRRGMHKSTMAIVNYICKCFGVKEEDLDDHMRSKVYPTAGMLNLDFIAQIMELDDVMEKLQSVDSVLYVTMGEKTLYFSAHLLNKILVVRSAKKPGVYCGFVELDIKDFDTPV